MTKLNSASLSLCLVVAVLLNSAAADVSYSLANATITAGGTALEGGDYRAQTSVAQTVTGDASDGALVKLSLGFWAATTAASDTLFVGDFEFVAEP